MKLKLTQLIHALRYKLRYGSTVEWYNFWYIVLLRRHKVVPIVASIDETIWRIVDDGYSVSRFGDGELLLTDPTKSIGFQDGDPLLAKRLSEILTSCREKHMVCISDTFVHLYRYNRRARRFWRTHFFLYGARWDHFLMPGLKYYNTFMTRPYMDFTSKKHSSHWFDELRGIWKGRDVVFIEGETSRLGVCNDFFDDARSVRRIICPSRNAFSRIDDILKEALKVEKEALFLIALGPTATVLAYDLYEAGYQAVDVGHVDVEYEWWRMRARRKVKLKHKSVNEHPNGKLVIAAGEEYQKQIIARITEIKA